MPNKMAKTMAINFLLLFLQLVACCRYTGGWLVVLWPLFLAISLYFSVLISKWMSNKPLDGFSSGESASECVSVSVCASCSLFFSSRYLTAPFIDGSLGGAHSFIAMPFMA